MAELLLLALLLSTAGLAVSWPLLDRGAPVAPREDDPETDLVRHRLALEALRDVEADHRAGSLDEVAYHEQRAEAEARVAATRPVVNGPRPVASGAPPATGGRTALVIGIGLAALLLVAFALPAPVGIGERTVTDQALADARAAEEARQARIGDLLGALEEDPRNPETLSALADAYLAGTSAQDRERGAVALLALIAIDPENASAYRRLITAYIDAGDWTDAAAALDAYAAFAAADEPDLPFFRGLIALRADGDPAEAVRQFDRFLQLAPHDPRAGMVLSLREQAAAREGEG